MFQHFICVVLLVLLVLCQSLDNDNDLNDPWTVFEHLWEKQPGLGYITQLAVGRSHTKDIDGNHYYMVTYNPDFDVYVSKAMLTTGGLWEKNMLSLFLFLLHTRKEPAPCVTVDAGAHVGTFTLFAASMGCHVLSFEIQFSSVALVHFSLRLSGYTHRVEQFNVALWNETGIELKWLDRYKNVGNADLFSALLPGTGKPVLSQRFDEIYNRTDDIFFMKMDVEKAEEYALQGTSMKFSSPPVFILSFR
jgi:FkbM family methyltransferase